MDNTKNITFVNEKNLLDTMTIDVLCAFEFDNNKYVVYDKNEKNFDGNLIIYIGKIEIVGNKQYIRNVDKEESDKIKGIIKKMLDYNGEKYDV